MTGYRPLHRYEAREQPAADRTGGADGNERLTAATGAVLLVLLAVEGFTILSIHQLLRVLGPVVLASSLGVLGTGVMLAVDESALGPWLFLHKVCFILWFGAMTIHVLAYVWRVPGLIGADLIGSRGAAPTRQVLAGRGVRWLLLGGSILAGLVIALTTLHLSVPWGGSAHL